MKDSSGAVPCPWSKNKMYRAVPYIYSELYKWNFLKEIWNGFDVKSALQLVSREPPKDCYSTQILQALSMRDLS